MNWFQTLTGLKADDPVTVREGFIVDGTTLTSRANGRVMAAGMLTTPSLSELRRPIPDVGPTTLRETVADVQALHCDPANAGAFFQVASQFNLLEMIDPNVAPEDGIARYGHDKTQGPACAIACGAGTLWRNYFAPVGTGRSGVGQNSWYQLDMLADQGAVLGNTDDKLWEMRNGYALPKPGGLQTIAGQIAQNDRDTLKNLLRIGIQSNTEVTLNAAGHTVTQAYCSALPVAYSRQPAAEWESFARLILDATYTATLYAALENQRCTGVNTVYLTLLGGGAFGNPVHWITDAIGHALRPFANAGLDLQIVSYGQANPALRPLLRQFGT